MPIQVADSINISGDANQQNDSDRLLLVLFIQGCIQSTIKALFDLAVHSLAVSTGVVGRPMKQRSIVPRLRPAVLVMTELASDLLNVIPRVGLLAEPTSGTKEYMEDSPPDVSDCDWDELSNNKYRKPKTVNFLAN
ncbi:hypothetical protein N7513_006291 [Penicillium frequentans]|nr:hypothetical protein N7513_006291 [Penicillium glabrum]